MHRFINTLDVRSAGGSFWYDKLDKSQMPFVEKMADLSDHVTSWGVIEKFFSNIVGETTYYKNDFSIKFKDNDIFVTGAFGDVNDKNEPIQYQYGRRVFVGDSVGLRAVRKNTFITMGTRIGYPFGNPDFTRDNRLNSIIAGIFMGEKPKKYETGNIVYVRSYDGTDFRVYDENTLNVDVSGNYESDIIDEQREDPDNNATIGFSPEKMYAVRIPKNIVPLHILSENGDMLLNVDYFYGGTSLVFKKPIDVLFPEKSIYVKMGAVSESGIYSKYLYGVANSVNEKNILNFVRKSYSLTDLEVAVADISGLPHLKSDATLVKIIEYDDRVEYVFNNAAITVNYPHIKLEIGKTYRKGFIPGDPVKFIQKSEDYAWYRKFSTVIEADIGEIANSLLKVPDEPVKCVLMSTYEDNDNFIVNNNNLFIADSDINRYNYAKVYGSVKLGKNNIRIKKKTFDTPVNTYIPNKNSITNINDFKNTGDYIYIDRNDLSYRLDSNKTEYVTGKLRCKNKLKIDGCLNISRNRIKKDNVEKRYFINKSYEKVFSGEKYVISSPTKLPETLSIEKNGVLRVNKYFGKHIRVEIPNTRKLNLIDLWERVIPKSELSSGEYLNSIAKLSYEHKSTYINLIDVILKTILDKNNSIAVLINKSAVDNAEEIKRFIKTMTYGGTDMITLVIDANAIKYNKDFYFMANSDNLKLKTIN